MATKSHGHAKPAPSHKHAGGGKTKVQQEGAPVPLLPSERDQSSDSQQSQGGNGSQREMGRQALEDVERGVVDTDLGPVTDRVYNDKLKP